MKHYQKLRLLTMILGGLLIYSCQNENEIYHQDESQKLLNDRENQKMTVLGKKLKNPYSVENMQKAWDNLKKIKNYKSKDNRIRFCG